MHVSSLAAGRWPKMERIVADGEEKGNEGGTES
jgi:hypothetical protein